MRMLVLVVVAACSSAPYELDDTRAACPALGVVCDATVGNVPAVNAPTPIDDDAGLTPKKCALWKIDPASLAVTHVLDLPSDGDTCFPGLVELGGRLQLHVAPRRERRSPVDGRAVRPYGDRLRGDHAAVNVDDVAP